MDEGSIRILNRLVDHYGPQHWWDDGRIPRNAITMILIQQTTAVNVERALGALGPEISFASIRALSDEELEAAIRPVGFYHQKAKSIRALLAWFATFGDDPQGRSDAPTLELRRELLGVRGIGEETADVILLYLFERPVFVADNYARRLFTRLGYGPFKTYRAMWSDFNPVPDTIDFATVREWHAVIDEHGKQFRRDSTLDESWLLE